MNNKDNPEEEKPLLDHLEDLRGMLLKVLITLVIGFSVCFGFRNVLMEVMRAPINGVWELQLDASLQDLPVPIQAQNWELVTKAAREGGALTESQRTYFYEALAVGNPEFLFHLQSILLWKSALVFPDSQRRISYIQGLPEINQRMREQLLKMASYYESSKGAGPNPDAELRKRTVFMQSLNPTEGFMLSFKLAMFAGVAVTFPFLLFFILQFVLPGLHDSEKKALYPALVIGFGLFISGVVFSYSMVLPRVLEFFTHYSTQMGIMNDWRIGEYISFTTQFVLIFGLAFELPVVVMTLVFLGVMEYQVMARSRAYAFVGILVLAAVITPTPDVLTLGLLAGPMYFLYELCILLAWMVEKKRGRKEREKEDLDKKELDVYLAKKRSSEAESVGEVGARRLTAPPGLVSAEEDDEG